MITRGCVLVRIDHDIAAYCDTTGSTIYISIFPLYEKCQRTEQKVLTGFCSRTRMYHMTEKSVLSSGSRLIHDPVIEHL